MRSKLVGALVGVLAVAFIALSALGGAMYWSRVQQRGQEATRAELPSLAIEQIPRAFGTTTRPSSAA